MKNRRWIALVLAACMLLGLTACEEEPEATVYEFGTVQPTQGKSDNASVTNQTGSGEDTTAPQNAGAKAANSFEYDAGLKSGSLLFTFTVVRAVNHRSDIPEAGGFNEYDAFIYQFRDGEEVAYHYPEMICGDGSFLEHCYLVLVDITVESKDAVAKTISADDDGARFDDPYIFRADTPCLVDLSQKQDWGYPVISPDYFSLLGGQEEHPWAFYLEPGQTIDFTLGFFIGGYDPDGTLTDMSQLSLCDSYGNLDSTFIRLGLGE